MPKLLYEYVIFNENDILEYPIAYKTIKELSKIFNISVQALHKRFNKNNIIYLNGYGIERFKKESE